MKNIKKNSGWLIVLSGLLVLIGGCRFFQEATREESPMSRLEQRVYDMEVDFGSIKKKIRDQEISYRSGYAPLKAEVDGLRTELQSLRGELESLAYELNQYVQTFDRSRDNQEKRISSLSRNLVGRITRIEQYLDFDTATGAENGIEDTIPITDTADAESEGALYKTALQLFEAGDYETARRSFEKLLAAWPESSLCDNARFWIGESHYREHWYEKAVLEYQKVIDDYPQGNKVPAALLKQGLAFSRINDDTSARLVLEKLIKLFPDTNEAAIAEKKLKEL